MVSGQFCVWPSLCLSGDMQENAPEVVRKVAKGCFRRRWASEKSLRRKNSKNAKQNQFYSLWKPPFRTREILMMMLPSLERYKSVIWVRSKVDGLGSKQLKVDGLGRNWTVKKIQNGRSAKVDGKGMKVDTFGLSTSILRLIPRDRPLLGEWPSTLAHARPLWLKWPFTFTLLDLPLWTGLFDFLEFKIGTDFFIWQN